TPQLPADVYRLQRGNLRKLGSTNDATLRDVALGDVRKVSFDTDDGTTIDAFVVFPPDFRDGARYPGLLRVHGGPTSQYDYAFHTEAQLLAAQGYVVVMPNPRGSSGYGQEFATAIFADWGGIDYGDVVASMDYAIDQGWVDPERTGVFGWSYGGIMTNHVITKTGRFKAAITGASATLYSANYGHDQYQRWWEYELGLPWVEENREKWERISPFYQLGKVTTPTLVVCGEHDWNVPLQNSEQLYAALKRLGVPTELVVYPEQYHGFSVPSYNKDLYVRYIDWFARYIPE
ncbi:MAG: S9 family peptidase, partial [Gammaproteobacteria bacterium]|nr:S9 family peptidase [Gammaproteobacteria bacterium]